MNAGVGTDVNARAGADARAAPVPIRVEIGLLAGMLFVLPAVEAPTHLLAFAWLAVWTVNRFARRDFGGPWRLPDTLLAASIISVLLSCLFALDRPRAWAAAAEPIRHVLLAWAVYRAGYGPADRRTLLLSVVAGVALPLVHGTWLAYGSGTEPWITLNSVGHVNHSAIYLALAALVALALVLFDRGIAPRVRGVLAGATVWYALSLALTASRAAMAAWLCAAAWIVWQAVRRRRTPIWPMVGFALAAVVVLTAATLVERSMAGATKQTWLDKFTGQAAAPTRLSLRDQTWANAIDAFRQSPLFGIGPENYRLLTPQRLCEWRNQRGQACDPATRMRFHHAHGLLFQTLADRGAVGLAVLAGLLAWWARAAFGRRAAGRSTDDDAPRLAAAAALLVVVVAGLFNTTLRVEHGLLAWLLLALHADRLRQAPRPPSSQPARPARAMTGPGPSR